VHQAREQVQEVSPLALVSFKYVRERGEWRRREEKRRSGNRREEGSTLTHARRLHKKRKTQLTD
jgi:hypothetical protein